jgi:hypothetical protein
MTETETNHAHHETDMANNGHWLPIMQKGKLLQQSTNYQLTNQTVQVQQTMVDEAH